MGSATSCTYPTQGQIGTVRQVKDVRMDLRGTEPDLFYKNKAPRPTGRMPGGINPDPVE
ncbi:hypothetical protein KIPB_013880, partial [Kipferlia bialata]|eukprot:g13880.t1